MANEREDGGPVSPVPFNPYTVPVGALETGMSTRDWFAGLSLTCLISVPGFHPSQIPDAVCMAYDIAQAMVNQKQMRDRLQGDNNG